MRTYRKTAAGQTEDPRENTLPGVEFVLLGLDLCLSGMAAVEQLPSDLVHHGNARRMAVHLRLQALEPGGGGGVS